MTKICTYTIRNQVGDYRCVAEVNHGGVHTWERTLAWEYEAFDAEGRRYEGLTTHEVIEKLRRSR